MSTGPQRRPGELGFAVLLVLGSLWLFWQSIEISGFTGLSTPGVFPMLASGLMVISALAILRDAARRGRAGGGGRGGLSRFLAEVTPLRQVSMLGLVAAYVASMPWLGFVLASGLFLLISIGFLWRRGFLLTVLLSGVSLGAIYVVFRVVFQVVLPKGTLIAGLL